MKFTIELEKDKKLAFLDVLLDHSDDNNLITSVYRKETFSGVLTNFYSFTPIGYKLGLVKCLIDRIYKINNNQKMLQENIKTIFNFLKRNLYPRKLLEKINRDYLLKKQDVSSTLTPIETDIKTIYFKLPYLGKKIFYS